MRLTKLEPIIQSEVSQKVKEASKTAGLKLNMASSPITSWQIEGEELETVTYFIFLCS